MTNVGGRRVSHFGPTLTDDERDSHPLIPPRFMHLRSLDSKSLFTVAQRRSPPLMAFYIFMEASSSRHFEFVVSVALLGKPQVTAGKATSQCVLEEQQLSTL